MNHARMTRFIISILVGVMAAAVIAYTQVQKTPPSDGRNNYIGQSFGDNFAGLTDQDGKILGPDAFAGKYQLVFFGFTHCPAICPAALQKASYILKNLDPKNREKLAVLFVTVDPERDTAKQMKSYISSFEQGITGITGSPERITKTVSAWKVYAAKVPQDGGDYTMDHSGFLYLRDPKGHLKGIYPHEDAPDVLLSAIMKDMGL